MKTIVETTITEWKYDDNGNMIKETKITSTQEKK
jgi:YD repeat-containing protein